MMSEIKLIALDLDGTLLDSEKRLSAGNEAALKECIRRGIAVVRDTGNPLWHHDEWRRGGGCEGRKNPR